MCVVKNTWLFTVLLLENCHEIALYLLLGFDIPTLSMSTVLRRVLWQLVSNTCTAGKITSHNESEQA